MPAVRFAPVPGLKPLSCAIGTCSSPCPNQSTVSLKAPNLKAPISKSVDPVPFCKPRSSISPVCGPASKVVPCESPVGSFRPNCSPQSPASERPA